MVEDVITHSDESLKKQAAMWGTRMNSNSTITSSNRYSFHNAEDLNENYEENNETPLTNGSSNIYNFDLTEISEEDIIKSTIESDISVFIHGKTGDGKSSRVKELDPTCEILYLRNMKVDSLNGKDVYNAKEGKMINVKPIWLKNIERKCHEEPNRIHIVFFDEITNALPSIQGMAYNIVLDRVVNGIWNLPENAKVVAAGNEEKDSTSACNLAEPLFDRFAHVYIHTDKDSWLKWAKNKNGNNNTIPFRKIKLPRKIHPAIYNYIYLNREEVFRKEYTGISPNATPRKWEMASRLLYTSNNPYMLRSLIGKELTEDFIKFSTRKGIGVNDIIENNIDKKYLSNMNIADKYVTTMGLTIANFDQVEPVRNFVKDNFGGELTALFDKVWIGDATKRLEKIYELSINDEVNSNEREAKTFKKSLRK